MRLKTFPQLKADGHPYCRVHTMRLVKAGKFPAPIRIGANRVAWDEAEIDAHLQRLAAQRATKPAN
jgi:prophage regulatory protein